MVTPKDIQLPIVKMGAMYIIEYHLGVEERRSTRGGKMGLVFMTPNPITGYVVMEIVSVVSALVHQQWRY